MSEQIAHNKLETDQGIILDILGDSRPFSKFGRSISYQLRLADHRFLIDCGAPIFEHLTREEIEDLDGLIATHSHEDHKRWFTDLSLYLQYVQGDQKLQLYTSETIHEEYKKNSRGALERTLTDDSKRVVEVPYEKFVDPIQFGPSQKYKIKLLESNSGAREWKVLDQEGNIVSPKRAKVVISSAQKANRPRLLFRDPDTGDWVEPESFYSFQASAFYESDRHPIELAQRDNSPITIQPLKAPVWHGPPTIGITITTPNEKVVFSSDTVYDPDLFYELAHDRSPLELGDRSANEFDQAQIIHGDINNFIQRTWSQERYQKAMNIYEDSVLIHDCGPGGNPVHSSYKNVKDISCDRLLLTHCPDQFVSELPISISGKTFKIVENNVYEQQQDQWYPLNADIYVRNDNQAYVGFQSADGAFSIMRHDGQLQIIRSDQADPDDVLINVDLYRDIQGQYLPYLEEAHQEYYIRDNGQVIQLSYTDSNVRAQTVESLRNTDGTV